MQVIVAIASLKDPQWMILLKSLDAIKTTITAQASDLRPGHHCIVKMPDNINPIYEDDMWVVSMSASLSCSTMAFVGSYEFTKCDMNRPPAALAELVTRSEVATIRAMESHGPRVPNAYLPPVTQPGGSIPAGQ